MAIILNVYEEWENYIPDEGTLVWSHAFPDSATPEEIATEFYNREPDLHAYPGFAKVLTCMRGEYDRPGTCWAITPSRIIRLEHH